MSECTPMQTQKRQSTKRASKHTWRWKHVKAVRLCHAIHTTRRYAMEGSHVFLCWRLTDPLWSSEIQIADKQEISKTICRPSTIMVVKIPHCELRANIQQVLIIGTARESISYGWHWELCTHVVMFSQTQPSVQLVIRPWKAISYAAMQSHWENTPNIPKHGSARRL